MLSETINELSPAVRNSIDQLHSAVDALERQTAIDAQKALQTAQQVTNSLQLSNKQPQLTHWEPQAEVADNGGNYRIKLFGNFFYASDPDRVPYIALAGKRIYPDVKTTQQLTFNLPRSNLLDGTGNPISFEKIDFVAPYREPYFLGLFEKDTDAQFSVSIVGLPKSPGEITVITYTPKSIPKTRHATTTADNQQSDRDDKVEIHCGPTETDKIDHNSVRFVVDRSEGDTWTHRPERYDNPSVCEWIRTEHHGAGTSDKVWFHFAYDVLYSESGKDESHQDIGIRWGDSHVIPIGPITTFNVIFDAFDGTHYEASGPEHSNRYLDVDMKAGGIRITARSVIDVLPR